MSGDPARRALLRQVHGWQDPEPDPDPDTEPGAPGPEEGRRLVVTCAASIKPKRVKWLWEARLALGTLGLLAGGEGLGKSTVAYDRCAHITNGTLQGEFYGTPKSVLVCATEDSWEETIVPRLIAHGADLNRVFRVEVVVDEVHTGLSLPKDLPAVEQLAAATDAVILLLDPLLSRIDSKLDTHKDAEVRRALEPIAALARTSNLFVLGIIHHNKSGSTNPLELVMASKAFTAVARSVHTVIKDPDNEDRRLFGMPKNNLGRLDLDTLVFGFTSYPVDTDDGPAWVGKVQWQGTSTTSISEAIRQTDNGETATATSEAQDWLEDFLTMAGGTAESATIKKAGKKAEHAEAALHRARRRLKLEVESHGMPRKTWWSLPGTQSLHPVGGVKQLK